MRRAGFLARLGGDEFGVLLEGVQEAKAAAVVDLIRIQAGEDGDETAGRMALKISAGWAIVGDSATNRRSTTRWRGADEALRRAKREGRNRTRPGAN